MSIARLLADPRAVPANVQEDERDVLVSFVGRRVRALLDDSESLRAPGNPRELASGSTAAMATRLIREIPTVRAAYATIRARVRTDREHMALDPEVIRRQVSGNPAGDPRLMRDRLVRSIVWQAAARDISLAEPGNINRLHELVDRRLRVAERMLHEVGRAAIRHWSRTQIASHPGGPWIDGLERLFEYPRVPQAYFEATCRPNPSADPSAAGRCQTPGMETWRKRGADHIVGPIRPNVPSQPSWALTREPGGTVEPYSLDYRPGHAPSAVAAIRQLFQPTATPGRGTRDFQARNLFFCDHVIHSLHLEALVFAKAKRGADPNWLDTTIDEHGPRWLRISSPFSSGDVRTEGVLRTNYFAASRNDPEFFAYARVLKSDLEVGDHVIVYNHPAYAHLSVAGAWRLENAVVVQTVPRLLLQGHGIAPQSIGGLQLEMVSLFNRELRTARARLEDLLARRAPRPVDNRPYEGFVVPGETIFFVRRHEPQRSEFAGIHRRADWYVVWRDFELSEQIMQNPSHRTFVRDRQLVEFTEEGHDVHNEQVRWAWFPLWQPRLNRRSPVSSGDPCQAAREGTPIRGAGNLIVATVPTVIQPCNIATWTWYFDASPQNRDMVPAIRPWVS